MSDHDRETLAELDRIAPETIGSGRPLRFAGRREELAGLDLRSHPWARLLVACTLWDSDCTDPRAVEHALAALRAFRRRRERRGEGYACFVLGTWAAMRGDIRRAGQWWDKAHPLVGAAAPASEIVLAHRGLVAYAEGRLTLAIAMAEEAAAIARLRRQPRQEATALVNVGMFRLWTGELLRALTAFNVAEDAFGELTDPFDRYELPLCFAGRGVLWAMRGDVGRAEDDFARGLTAAAEVREPLLEAIVLVLRADLTAADNPRRARDDARRARAELERRGERWWSTWAIHAGGVAALEAGMVTAAETIFREVLRQPQPFLERARTLLLLGETLLRAGCLADAGSALRVAVDTFEAAGARYWAARACVRLSNADPAHAAAWISRAKRLSTADPAFDRLFAATSALRLVAFGPGEVLYSGQPVRLRTAHAARAVFLLALAGQAGMNVEQLAEHLWPERVDRARLLARVRTLLWDVRQGLGPEAWRLCRRGPIIALDITGVRFDLPEARAAAVTGGSRPGDLSRLRQPVLTQWIYEDWVVAQQRHNERLAAQAPAAGKRNRPPEPAHLTGTR